MDPSVFLVLAVHKVAAAAELAIAAEAGEEADADPLAHCPALDTGTDAADDLVTGTRG
jgi:hypothetical protein